MKSALMIFLLVAGATLCGSSVAEQLVREFAGDKNATTAEFTVDGPWLLDWRLNTDYRSAVAMDIMLIDARSGKNLGRVVNTRDIPIERLSNGLKLFEEGGTFRLRVSTSFARWRVMIKSIDEEEIERYTPRKDAAKEGFSFLPD